MCNIIIIIDINTIKIIFNQKYTVGGWGGDWLSAEVGLNIYTWSRQLQEEAKHNFVAAFGMKATSRMKPALIYILI